MSDEMMSLRGPMEKSADADLLRETIGFAAELLLASVGGDLPDDVVTAWVGFRCNWSTYTTTTTRPPVMVCCQNGSTFGI